MIPRCVVCDAPVPNVYAPSACCEGETCPKEGTPRGNIPVLELTEDGQFTVTHGDPLLGRRAA